MKQVILLLSLMLSSLSVGAQIYTIRQKIDKFDDEVFNNREKTLITQYFTDNDSTITFEVKGHKPVTYYIYGSVCNGTRTDEVNIVDNIYGCEENYYATAIDHDTIGLDSIARLEKLIESLNPKNIVIITHRTISKYSFKRSSSDEFPYGTDLWWIRFSDGSRIIYQKDLY